MKTAPAEWSQLLFPELGSNQLDLSAVTTDQSGPWRARYNVAPTQAIVGLVEDDRRAIAARYYRWGLVPFWADDLAIGNRMINARSETLADKPAFRSALARQRCVIVADGYYEWKTTGKQKQPFWIHRDDEQVFAFAGLWERNRKATDQEVLSATIITAAAAPHLADLHDRMPAIFSGQALLEWLAPATKADRAMELLASSRDTDLQARPVSTHVNNPRNEDPGCLEP